ncbi:DsbA family oxidoreductase [Acrocarpospora pleiomorpha]|uniref:DsbA family oxidoreductase n=1 Tax=Acrocarpospora pleiomorpha TaxID=90975 RepID=UPI0012D2DF10|nr:DsbA family oxidoreductase [Acrocarpospora pleiomorpha]
MVSTIKVDIWSDIACPFCYIGKRKFEAAVAASGLPVEVEFHSFELAPDTPEDVEESHVQLIAHKMGVPLAQAREMEQHVLKLAHAVGLEFDYGQLKMTKTLRAHELLHYAKTRGLQAEMKERLMAAYFTEGRHVGRVSDLADLAAEIGLDRDDVVRSLNSDEHLSDVQADLQQAARYGIRGVPFFVFDGKYAVSGAQESTTFADVLTKVHDEKENAA